MISKIILLGILVWVICEVFSIVGTIGNPPRTYVLGDAFQMLGAMAVWSLFTIVCFIEFTAK